MSELILLVISILTLFASFIAFNHLSRRKLVTKKFESRLSAITKISNDKQSTRSPLQQLSFQSGLNLPTYMILIGAITLSSTAALGLISIFPSHPIVAGATGILFLPIAWLLIKDLLDSRIKKFQDALNNVTAIMYSASLGGASPMLALEQAAITADGFVKTTLLNVLSNLEMGADVSTAMKVIDDKYPSESSRLFVNTLKAHWYSNTRFEQVLAALSSVLRERSHYRKKMQGQLSGARYAAIVTSVFPYLLIPFLNWQQPQWLLPLTEHPQGPLILFSALLCQVIGFIWLRSILRSDL